MNKPPRRARDPRGGLFKEHIQAFKEWARKIGEWIMSEELGKINFIDSKIAELEVEKSKAGKDLADYRSSLGSALVSESLGEGSGSGVPRLREKIASHEQRISEINSTISGLRIRRKQEENRLHADKVNRIRRALQQIDLECYRAYREELVHNKVLVVLRKTYAALQLRREEECTKLSAIGVDTGLGIFIIADRWFSSDSGRAASGQNPWQDTDTDEGMKFMDEEIARLEKELAV